MKSYSYKRMIMENIFNYDNKFFRALTKLVDCVLLSAAWLICCIPIFTIGASTTAMYYAAHKTLVRGKGYILSSFWEGFKSNFKRSTGIWLIQLVVMGVLAGDIYITHAMLKAGNDMGVFYYLFLIMMLYAVIWMIYTVSYEARFENTWKNIIKNAAIFSVIHLKWSICMLALLLVVIFVIIVMPPFIFLFPAALFASYAMILEKKVFRKYMSESDLQKELEDDKYDET